MSVSSVSGRIGKGRRVHAVILDADGARSLCGRAGGWKVGDAPVDCIACLVRLARAAR